MPAPLLIGHRGAPAEQPENTLASFRRALAIGVDAIELDVQLTRDGVPVVFHDATLRRMTGQPGRVAKTSWPDLQSLRIAGDHSLPRLQDVLRLVGGRAVVQVEIKAGVAAGPVIGAIASAGAKSRVIVASFEFEILREAADLAPEIPRMLISSGRSSRATLVRRLASLKAGGLSVDHRAVRNAGWVRHFRARGFSVWCWTVNDPVVAGRLARWGMDGILTDNPALLRRQV